LRAAVQANPNVQLLHHIKTEEIDRLVASAHINVLPTFQATGMKLKLINVLFRGKHCLVNTKMVKNTGVEHLCHIADNEDAMKMAIEKLIGAPFDREELRQRSEALEDRFSNRHNARLLLGMLETLHDTYRAVLNA
jgi:hypothetical protein